MKYQILVLLSFSFLFSQAQVDFTANEVCQGSLTTLTGSSTLNDTSITSWNWDLDADGSYDDAVGKLITYTFPTSDSFQVGLTIKVKSGQDDTTVKTVVVHPLPDITLQGEDVCQGSMTTFSTQTNIAIGSVQQYKWDFNGDAVYDKVTTGGTTDFYYGPTGSYDVTVLGISTFGCESSANTSVDVYAQPTADFSFEQGKKAREQVSFQNKTVLAKEDLQYYLWYFGDGKSEVTQGDGFHAYDSAGSYQAQLIAVANNSCRDTAQKTVQIDSAEGGGNNGNGTGVGQANSNLIITPNGDGVNDKLYFEKVQEGHQCELIIFNRWNQVIYQSDAYQNDWKGTKNDAPVEAGAYYYRLSCGDSTTIGNVNILR